MVTVCKKILPSRYKSVNYCSFYKNYVSSGAKYPKSSYFLKKLHILHNISPVCAGIFIKINTFVQSIYTSTVNFLLWET